jgi:hypothetical protein
VRLPETRLDGLRSGATKRAGSQAQPHTPPATNRRVAAAAGWSALTRWPAAVALAGRNVACAIGLQIMCLLKIVPFFFSLLNSLPPTLSTPSILHGLNRLPAQPVEQPMLQHTAGFPHGIALFNKLGCTSILCVVRLVKNGQQKYKQNKHQKRQIFASFLCSSAQFLPQMAEKSTGPFL